MEYLNLKKELQEFIEQAEDLAIDYIENNINFHPYLYLGEKKIRKIISNSLDRTIELAEEEIENLDKDTVVLIFKNKISLKDGSFDAIVSQLYNSDEEFGYSYGLLYKIENNKIQFLNKRIFLGNVRNCLVY